MGDIFGTGTTTAPTSGYSYPAVGAGDTFGYGGPGWSTPSTVAPAVQAPSTWSNIASGLGKQVSSLGVQALPFAMLMASNYIEGNKNKQNAQQAQQGSLQTWQQNAFPQPSVANAAATDNRGQRGQARHQSYQNLASNLASRGWGSGSGLIARGGRGIEGDYLKALGKQATDMTKFANTPMFGMPQSAYPTPVSGGTEQALGSMDTALGYYMMLQALRG